MQVNNQMENKHFCYTSINACHSQSLFVFCFRNALDCSPKKKSSLITTDFTVAIAKLEGILQKK